MTNATLELLPINPSMILPMKYSVMSPGLFRSYGLRTKYHAKNVYVCTCCGTGYLSPSSR